jgi:hypothetical protein
MRLYYEDQDVKLYQPDTSSEDTKAPLILETTLFGEKVSYELVGNPYEPSIEATCSNPSKSFHIRGSLWFPNKEPGDSNWGDFCKDFIKEAQKATQGDYLGIIQYRYKKGVLCEVHKDTDGVLYLRLYNPDKRDFDKAGELGFKLDETMRLDIPQFKYYERDGYRYILSNEGIASATPEMYNIMTFDEIILASKTTFHDNELAQLATLILQAYNGSYKPHLIQKDIDGYIKHTKEGYSLISKENGKEIVLTTDSDLADFLEHVFLTLSGMKYLNIDEVCNNGNVKHVLEDKFGMKVNLSLAGHNDPYKEYTLSSIWINNNDWSIQKELENLGFYFYDRDIWVITL